MIHTEGRIYNEPSNTALSVSPRLVWNVRYAIGIPHTYFIIATCLLISARYGACLHCFQCQNVSEGVDCNVVAECNFNESCFIERSGPVNNTLYSLGCMPRQHCPAEYQFTMVGRAAHTHCKKCCSVDGCNNRYCEPIHPTGTCIDSPSVNCSKWAALIDICSTPHRAKDICRKHCGLCRDMVDGSWGQWRGWSTCSTTCGIGQESRTRQCNDPAPAHGGYDCPGNKDQQRSCFPRACPVHGGWSIWAQWEGCSVQCGNGLKKRHRTCSNPPPSLYGHFCLGDPVDFSPCQGNACGNHTTTSTPVPTTSHCEDILDDCDIANTTLRICNNFESARKSCAEFCGLCGIVDGVWAVWSHWGSCSTSCGRGTAARARTCTNPPPQNGGKTCAGNNTETKSCTLRACPVHGGWGNWAHWSSCSSTCGPGSARRTRVCDNPRPQLLGNFCFGDSTDFGICSIKPCPVDGGWTDWSFWSSCSVTCGNGHAVRQRSCTNPTPTNGGLHCAGSKTEQKTCNIANCPVNGGWSTWTSWSSCSNSVAWGLSQRQRTCTNPSPSALGRGCIGDSSDKRPCPGAKSGFTVTRPVAGLTSGTIRLTHVVTNIGGHYTTSTGIFTCEYPGMYYFALHIMEAKGSVIAYCRIRKNGSNVVKVYTAAANGYYSSTNSVVMHLVHGDKIDVGGCSSIANILSDNDYETNFSGFLLKAD